jgi:hypothetical protein
MKPRKDSADRGAGSGCMARLVRFFFSRERLPEVLFIAWVITLASWGAEIVENRERIKSLERALKTIESQEERATQ